MVLDQFQDFGIRKPSPSVGVCIRSQQRQTIKPFHVIFNYYFPYFSVFTPCSSNYLLTRCRYDFDILHEKGNYEHWEFTAVIYETMSFIPMLTNVNYANYILKPSTSKDHFKILSNYQTCFFKYACCKTNLNLLFVIEFNHFLSSSVQ